MTQKLSQWISYWNFTIEIIFSISKQCSLYFSYRDIHSIHNHPHLLNKYQINMVFSHSHEFGILSMMYILAPYQIYIVKECGFCNGSIILI